MSSGFDRRITPARPDIAAAHLAGKVQAERFVPARVMSVSAGVVPLRPRPELDAPLDTELLYGERFNVYDRQGGWVWGQSVLDDYVGYAPVSVFVPAASLPNYRVCTLRTPLLSEPDVKSPAKDILTLNAKLAVAGEEKRFLKLDNGGFVFSGHAEKGEVVKKDWVAIAERFLGTPYLWGGKTARGIDCSGLIQTALEAGRAHNGAKLPRDSDMMEARLGQAVGIKPDLSGLQRGDLIFWKGHVGVMLSAEELLHANAFHMEVAREPLKDAVSRIGANGDDIRAIKRL